MCVCVCVWIYIHFFISLFDLHRSNNRRLACFILYDSPFNTFMLSFFSLNKNSRFRNNVEEGNWRWMVKNTNVSVSLKSVSTALCTTPKENISPIKVRNLKTCK